MEIKRKERTMKRGRNEKEEKSSFTLSYLVKKSKAAGNARKIS